MREGSGYAAAESSHATLVTMIHAVCRGVLGLRRPVAWLAATAIAFSVVGIPAATREAAAQASRRAWLGVEFAAGPAGGVVATHVVSNSPAARAGMVDGDQIVAVDGTPLDDPKQLVTLIAIAGPGSTITVRIRRGGTEREVPATLVAHPGADQILRLDKIGTFAPTWKPLASVAGTVPSNIGLMRGRVVVIDFWATWCLPCRMMSTQLSRWQSVYGAQGLAIVGLTSDAVPIAAQAAQAQGMRYAVASDPQETTARIYGVKAIPTMFVIDKRGVIREVFVGYEPGRHSEIEKLLQTLLAEPAPAAGPG
jgi:peroxiredoxin